MHLTVTGNWMSLNPPPVIFAMTWLTGGGPNFDDWSNPVFQIADTASGNSGSGANFDATYDVTLDKLPLDPTGQYRVLKIPFLDPNDPTKSLGGSGRLNFTLGSPAVMSIVQPSPPAPPAPPLPYAYAIAQPDFNPNGAGSLLPWDFVEYNCATPSSNGRPVCVIDTTNVDFFALGITIKGRQSDETSASFGLSLGTPNPVQAVRTALANLPSDYTTNATMTDASGNFLRFLSPAHTFTPSTTALASAIAAGYTYYQGTPLQFTIGASSFSATSDGSTLTFTQPDPVPFTIGTPSSLDVVAATGPLDTGAAGLSANAVLARKYVAAYLNRGVFQNPATWWTPAGFYPAGGNWNQYSQLLHSRFINGLAYGFSYDDVPSPPPPTVTTINTCTSATLVIGND